MFWYHAADIFSGLSTADLRHVAQVWAESLILIDCRLFGNRFPRLAFYYILFMSRKVAKATWVQCTSVLVAGLPSIPDFSLFCLRFPFGGGGGLPPSTFDSSLVREISPIPFTHSSSVMNSSPNTWFQPLFHHQFRLFLMFSLCRCSRSTPSHFPLFLSGTDVAGFTISVLSTFLYFLHFSVIYCNLFGKPLLQFFFSSVFPESVWAQGSSNSGGL